MKYTADTITPDVIVMYRLYRFGDAGRCGEKGVRRAATVHGVGVRAWYMYEKGTRNPKLAERQRIARWLNSESARRHATPEPEPEPETKVLLVAGTDVET